MGRRISLRWSVPQSDERSVETGSSSSIRLWQLRRSAARGRSGRRWGSLKLEQLGSWSGGQRRRGDGGVRAGIYDRLCPAWPCRGLAGDSEGVSLLVDAAGWQSGRETGFFDRTGGLASRFGREPLWRLACRFDHDFTNLRRSGSVWMGACCDLTERVVLPAYCRRRNSQRS